MFASSQRAAPGVELRRDAGVDVASDFSSGVAGLMHLLNIALFILLLGSSSVVSASRTVMPASAQRAAPSAAPPPQDAASSTAPLAGDARDTPAWASLIDIAGTWAIAEPASDTQRSFRVRYSLLANGAALVETYGDPDGRFTQTVFHPDGARVLATHYCAQGNQPRLRLIEDGDTLRFDFLDATNLKSKSDSHLVRLDLRRDGEALIRREVYSSAAGEENDVLVLRRDK